jgi:hypothetical protein
LFLKGRVDQRVPGPIQSSLEIEVLKAALAKKEKRREEKEILKGSHTVLITALGSWGNRSPSGIVAKQRSL